jgi:hypothetical protein
MLADALPQTGTHGVAKGPLKNTHDRMVRP